MDDDDPDDLLNPSSCWLLVQISTAALPLQTQVMKKMPLPRGRSVMVLPKWMWPEMIPPWWLEMEPRSPSAEQ